ncbi:hypothetical protein ACFY5K_25815 [Streptomyces griseofuscus]|uniref:hypothetical protein n=1 Tax=Streptomyces griseofuscus TaxID=146922 RepID=UPI0036A1AC0E
MSMCAVPATRKRNGGFTATREFGFTLEKMFPALDLNDVDTEGAAVIVRVDNPVALNLFKLSRYLLSAAKGGVKTAVVVIPSRGLTTAIPLFNLFLAVDESAQLKDMMRLERIMRAGG